MAQERSSSRRDVQRGLAVVSFHRHVFCKHQHAVPSPAFVPSHACTTFAIITQQADRPPRHPRVHKVALVVPPSPFEPSTPSSKIRTLTSWMYHPHSPHHQLCLCLSTEFIICIIRTNSIELCVSKQLKKCIFDALPSCAFARRAAAQSYFAARLGGKWICWWRRGGAGVCADGTKVSSAIHARAACS